MKLEEKLAKSDSKAELIGPPAYHRLLIRELFRSSIEGSTWPHIHPTMSQRNICQVPNEAEVDQSDVTTAIEDQIVRLDVTMHES